MLKINVQSYIKGIKGSTSILWACTLKDQMEAKWYPTETLVIYNI